MSKEVFKTAERREAKGKGVKERYIHLNGEFQRIARRDKKAFLSDQCKEIEEKKRSKRQRGKGRYTQLNPDFQRIAMRDKKAFLSE